MSRKSSSWCLIGARLGGELTKRRRDSTRGHGPSTRTTLGRKPRRLRRVASSILRCVPLLVIDHDNRRWPPKDQNIGYVAEYLTAVDIKLKEARVVGDEETAIIDARRRVARGSAGVLYRRPRARARCRTARASRPRPADKRRRRITCIVTFATTSTSLLSSIANRA